MHQASFTLDPAFRIAEVDPRIYGSFVEHMGRCVYTGIYEPEHPTADENGFRQDVANFVRELGVPIVRYPGGNFVSGYLWEDGIGPRDQRPTRLDLAWRSIETNQVGVDDFEKWAASVGTETMMAVNLGTRGVDEARHLLEYCNYPGGSAWSDRRAANGSADPYGVQVWCLGNEMDGPWQIGHKTAYEYGRLASETAKAMRLVDPSVELVACGSSNSRMPTFGTWEATVLGECYDQVDYISMHTYYEERKGDRDSFLASSVDMDNFIDAVVATADHVRAKGRHKKRINISFDEWNVWYQSKFVGEENLDWEQAPRLIEDIYNVVDAVVVGTCLNSLLRHADRVSVACLAQLVNVIAPIMTEPGGPAWRQTIYHPFALTSRYGRGAVLRLEVDSPVHDTAWQGEVPVVDATAVQRDDDEVVLFLVNRDQSTPATVDVDVRAFPALAVGRQMAIFDDDPEAVNTADSPDRVVPRTLPDLKVDGGRLSVELAPLSWNMVRVGAS